MSSWQFATESAADAAIRERLGARELELTGSSDPSNIEHEGHRAMFADVLAAVESGGKPLIDGHEGRQSVELILAIYEAAQSGCTVQLPLAADPPTIRTLHGDG